MLRKKAEVLAGRIYTDVRYAAVILYLGVLGTRTMG